MVEMEFIENSNKKHVRQPPSVPFLWEIKPGTPKKDWKPEVSTVVSSVPTPPAKLIASVPFKWEEKPGTPLPNFSHRPFDQSVLPTPPSKEPIPLPAPPMYSHSTYKDENTMTDDATYNDDNSINDGAKTDDSFSSAPSLLANCLISSVIISTAVPAQEVSAIEDYGGLLETPSSPASETGSSTSSYAAGVSSLVGSSFLEWLFPLFPPHSGFLRKVEHSEHSLAPPDLKSKHFDHEDNGSVVARPTTLGELIMMSRRRSYRRKTFQMRKQNLSAELMKNSAFGCCFFGTGSKMIEGLHSKRKQLPRLKLLP
ncbi:hypothetical protein FNV43_RR24202 [Rhamnella rubrinervis]|uniref:Hydroxyproline-rich glycoprotein family protein n=1 Tax=Rhamnella rubrinervis TaxID=2594499 RepID=A0A8K0DLA6_9ROSA|nr:hypothetical protein FNV43_RR24202 [Rhamnella rubrinervis]